MERRSQKAPYLRRNLNFLIVAMNMRYCYHSFTSEKCDFLEVSHSLTGVSAYVAQT